LFQIVEVTRSAILPVRAALALHVCEGTGWKHRSTVRELEVSRYVPTKLSGEGQR